MVDILIRAGINTLMGMGTVFVVLIFIAFIISRFKYISILEEKLRNKKTQTMSLPTDIVVETEETEALDDRELVAVITAALAASLNTSVDQLVVRSIKRKNSNRW